MLKPMMLLPLISSPTTFYFLLLYCTLFFENSSCGDRNTMAFGEAWSSPSNFPRNYDQRRGSSSRDLSINEIPRLPVWNGANYGEGQRQIDFTQLFELMGEPRGSRGRELSELITRPKPKCNRRIRILNGVTRIRERGSLARFQCSHGFTLIGPTTVVCLRDRWSEDPPICVKSGCRPLRKPDNGEMRQSIGGAVSAFYCIPTAKLIGNPVIYCDGNIWNGTEPVCHVEPETTTTTVTTTTLADEDATEDPELEWDTNLQVTQSTTEQSLHFNGNMSEKPAIYGESTSERIPSHHPLLIQVSTEATIQLNHPPTTIKILQSEHTTEKEALSFNFSDNTIPPYHEATTIGVMKGQSETPLFFVSAFLSSTSSRSFDHGIATPPPEPSRSESQRPISDAPSLVVSVTPAAEGLYTAAITSLELNSPYHTTVPNPISLPPTTTRRFKIWTKRPRPSRPLYTRKPGKRPLRKRSTTTTTTGKPRITRYPQRKRVSIRPRRPVTIKASTPAILPGLVLVPGGSIQSTIGGDSSDYAIAIDKEFLPREQAPPIEIKPDMLNINISKLGGGSRAEQSHQLAHSSVIGGVIFFVIGLSTFSAGVILYCWRKNKGIARARPYDVDGRTLSLHDANDDFTWLDQNQRETNSAL